jgi:hypothetical protein
VNGGIPHDISEATHHDKKPQKQLIKHNATKKQSTKTGLLNGIIGDQPDDTRLCHRITAELPLEVVFCTLAVEAIDHFLKKLDYFRNTPCSKLSNV